MKNTTKASYSPRYEFPSKVMESVVCVKALVNSQASIPLQGASGKALNIVDGEVSPTVLLILN